MIASLEGIVTEKYEDCVVISVNGVGFRVFVCRELSNMLELHKVAAVYTSLVVREESLTLYGFETLEEKNMFGMLLSVSGVGPRTAMALISCIEIETIRKAVINEQPELLSKVTGVGKKTAQSIILHLQGKISGEKDKVRLLESDVDRDVIAALTSLGYSLVEAQAAIQMIPADTPQELETRVRAALRYFS